MKILVPVVSAIALLILWLQPKTAVPPSPRLAKPSSAPHVRDTTATPALSPRSSGISSDVKKPAAAPKTVGPAVSRHSPAAAITPHDDRMTAWLLETGQRAQSLRIKETLRKPAKNNSQVIEGVSEEGHSLKEHVDAEGRLIADEIIFSDGRKLSRLYYPDGQFKAVYFEQNAGRAYSGLFDENGRTLEVTELSSGGKHTRKNPGL